MSTRHLVIIGASKKQATRTFVLELRGQTVQVWEWKRDGIVAQDSVTLTNVPSKIQFAPDGGSVVYQDTNGVSVLAWDKDTGFGSQVGSTISGGLNGVSPSSNAIAIYTGSDTDIRNFSSNFGVGSVVDTVVGQNIQGFSPSGNYLTYGKNLNAGGVYEWNISTGVGSSYTTGTSLYGAIHNIAMAPDDSYVVLSGSANGGGLHLFPFDGSSFSVSSETITLGTSVTYSLEINNRQDVVLGACADSSSPYDFVFAVPISADAQFGNKFSTPPYLKSLSTAENARLNATSNIVAFSQNGNFVIAKFTNDGFGKLEYRDQSSGLPLIDVVEVDA